MQEMISVYARFKRGLGEQYGLTEDILHLHAGLLLFFASALVFRRRMRSFLPIAIVYFFAFANEGVDLLSPDSANNPLEPMFDIINTVFWPTLLFLLARRRVNADVDGKRR